MVELTRDEAIGLVDFLDITLFDAIRNDPDIDGMGWLCNMMMVYKKCKECIENGSNEK